MTIASEITRLQDVRTDIYDELGNKCVNLDGSSKYADVAPIIKKMPVVCAKIGANKYPVVKIGNQLWTAKNLDEDLGTIGTNEWYYNGRTEKTRVNVTTRVYVNGGSTTNSIQFYDWYDGKKSSVEKGASFPSRNIRLSLDYSISSIVTSGCSIYINGLKDDGTISTGSWCGGIDFPELSGTKDVTFTIPSNLVTIFSFRFSGLVDRTFEATNIRMCYGSADCGTNAIDVPTALANEATYKKYGRLYTWDNVNTNLASLGLNGWRWATKTDYDSLISLDSTGNKFRATYFANGTDYYGLSIIPNGYKASVFGGINSCSYIWTSTESYSSNAYRLMTTNSLFAIKGDCEKKEGMAVRLVLDLNEDGSIPDGAVIIAEADEDAVATIDDVETSTNSEG